MERIPHPFPEKDKEEHYLDAFSTPSTNGDGIGVKGKSTISSLEHEQESCFATGEFQSDDKEKLTSLLSLSKNYLYLFIFWSNV